VTGGISDNVAVLSSAELYDPTTGTFKATGSMSTGRVGQTATLLQNGNVLVAGGGSGSAQLASAEVYNATTGKFKVTGKMATARANGAAILLSDGRVLIEGGFRVKTTVGLKGSSTTSYLALAEIYSTRTGRFSKTGGMLTSRQDQAVALLKDGRVLVVGGWGGKHGSAIATLEIFNPAKGSWSAAGTMPQGRRLCSATTLQDGLVLITGGFNNTAALNTSFLYVP
jgi:N-acetylneuraminic acid mutarotase